MNARLAAMTKLRGIQYEIESVAALATADYTARELEYLRRASEAVAAARLEVETELGARAGGVK